MVHARGMHLWHWLRNRFSPEQAGWFGAGLGVAALCMVGYQVVAAALLGGPPPQPRALAAILTPSPTRSPLPTRTPTNTTTPFPTRTPLPTRTPTPTPTPFPTRTPRPTPTPPPGQPLLDAAPDAVVAVVATFVARTNAGLQPLIATAGPGR
jgi:hypothetical protein